MRFKVDVLGKDEVDAGRDGDADERQKVGGSDDAALVLVWRFVLDERVHRHGEKSRPEAQHAEEQRRSCHAVGRDAENETGDGHADRSERNEPVLDLVIAQPSSGHAADADAHGEHGVQVAGFGLADVQHIGPVNDDGGEEQGAKKPEVGVAQHGQKQRRVLAHFADLHPEIANNVQAEGFFRRGGRHVVDAEAGYEADSRKTQQHVTRNYFAPGELLTHPRADDRTNDDGQKRPQLDDAIAPRQSFLRQQFRKKAILRRPEECGLTRHQRERDQRKRERVRGEAGCRQQHRSEFHDLGPDRDPSLAEVVRQPAAGHAEDQKRHREQKGDHRDKGLALGLRHVHPDDDREQQIAQDVVAEGALKLRCNQRPKAAATARRSGGGRAGPVCHNGITRSSVHRL